MPVTVDEKTKTPIAWIAVAVVMGISIGGAYWRLLTTEAKVDELVALKPEIRLVRLEDKYDAIDKKLDRIDKKLDRLDGRSVVTAGGGE